MLEFLTGTGLAVSAGLNAYIPLLALGLAGRFLDAVSLPAGWTWLENPWVLGILAVLLVVELVADKIPVVDHFNDWIQTVVRPTAGGLAFGSGATATTAAVTNPQDFFSANQWVPIALGVAIALAVHLAKSAVRPMVNAATAGIMTPVVSAAEDVGSVVLTVFAILVPVLVVLALAVAFWFLWRVSRRWRKRNGPSREEPAASAKDEVLP